MPLCSSLYTKRYALTVLSSSFGPWLSLALFSLLGNRWHERDCRLVLLAGVALMVVSQAPPLLARLGACLHVLTPPCFAVGGAVGSTCAGAALSKRGRRLLLLAGPSCWCLD